MSPLKIGVWGTEPITRVNTDVPISAMQEWRNKIYEIASQSHKDLQNRPIGETTLFSVYLKFYLSAGKLWAADLDNLAKPVLDTLFTNKGASESSFPTGALVNVSDSQVFELKIEKTTPDIQKGEKCGVWIEFGI